MTSKGHLFHFCKNFSARNVEKSEGSPWRVNSVQLLGFPLLVLACSVNLTVRLNPCCFDELIYAIQELYLSKSTMFRPNNRRTENAFETMAPKYAPGSCGTSNLKTKALSKESLKIFYVEKRKCLEENEIKNV